MKKIIIVSLFAVLGACAGIVAPFISYKPLSVTVSTNSVLIAPALYTTTTNAWSSNSVAAYGDLLSVSNRIFWCVTAGTNAAGVFAAPADGDVTSGGATWRVVRKVRNFISIQNHGATNVYLAFGNAAEKNKGVMLIPNAQWTSVGGVPQTDIYAIGEATGLVLCIQEN